MRTEKAAKVAISNRISPDNYVWLKENSAKIERSFNWLLDKVITEARLADNSEKSVNTIGTFTNTRGNNVQRNR